MKTQQQGFSLIELVIVIVILGILAATAIPRFLNITDDAENASIDGVSGGLATAVSFVRSQWEVDGRSSDEVMMDGSRVTLDGRFGFPTGAVTNIDDVTNATLMTDVSCRQVFNNVQQNAPRNVLFNEDAREQRYTVKMLNGVGGDTVSLEGDLVENLDLCVYHLVTSLKLNQTTGVPEGTLDLSVGKGVIYNPGTGQVLSFTN